MLVFIFRTCLAICVASILCHQKVLVYYNYYDHESTVTQPHELHQHLHQHQHHHGNHKAHHHDGPSREGDTNLWSQARTLPTKAGTVEKKSTAIIPEKVAISRKLEPNTKEKTKNKSLSMSSTTTKTKTPCPEEYRKLVWFEKGSGHKLYEPISRAFHSRGWSVARDVAKAHFLWRDHPSTPEFHANLQPWQRYNFFPNTKMWDDKDTMALYMRRYYEEKQKKSSSTTIVPLHSFPESYVLHMSDGLEAFRVRMLEENGGLDIPWVLKEPTVNKGKGVTMLAPQSDELKGLVERIKSQTQKKRLVIQKYICDEMTYGSRKFDVRIYWTVASIDPLIVLYHTK